MIGRKSFLIVLSRAASAGLAFIGLAFITRYLGKDIYGSLAWTMAFVATFNSIADLGFSSAHIKRVSEGKKIDDCVSTFMVVKLFLTGIMVVTVLVSIFVWTGFSGEQYSSTTLSLILMFILYYVFYDVASIATATFDARVQTARTQVSALMDPLIRVPLVVFVCVNRMGALELAYAYVLGGLGVAVVGLLLLSRERLYFRRPRLLKSYVSFAIPIALVSVMAAVSSNADKLLIGFFWSDANVADYSVSQSFLSLFAVIGTAVSTLTFPTFSRMQTERRTEEMRSKTRLAERYISMLAFPIVILILLFPEQILVVIFSATYETAANPLRFLSISMLLTLLNGVYASQINAVNRPDITAKLTFLSLVVNIALLVVFIPTSILGIKLLGLSATGAAIANVIGVATLFVATRLIVFKLTGTRSNRGILYHIVAGIMAGAVLAILNTFWTIGRWFDVIGYGLISVGLFAGILYFMRQLTKEDIRFFLSVINPMEMKDYISSELKRRP